MYAHISHNRQQCGIVRCKSIGLINSFCRVVQLERNEVNSRKHDFHTNVKISIIAIPSDCHRDRQRRAVTSENLSHLFKTHIIADI